MAWKELQDFDGSISGFTMTVRVTKSDDTVKPRYSVAIGTRNDLKEFRPFLRGDILGMSEDGKVKGVSRSGVSVLYGLFVQAEKCIAEDKKAHLANLDKDEANRRAFLAGKRGGDSKANGGLNAVGKTAKKREKEARRQTDSS